MISERQHGFYRVYLLVMAFSAALLFICWSHVFDRFSGKNLFRHSPKLLYICIQGGVFFLYGILHSRWDAVLLGRDRRAHLMMGFRQASVMVLALLVFLVATKDTFVSRYFLFSYIPLLTLFMVALNAVLPALIPLLIFGGPSSEGAVLLSPDSGEGSLAIESARLREWIAAQRDCGILISGVLAPDRSLSNRCRLPYLGDASHLGQVLAEPSVRSLYLTHLPDDREQLAEMIALCEGSAVRFSTILDLQARVGRPVYLSSSNGMQLLVVRREPLENPVRRLAKRGFDVIFSLIVLLTLLPPIALITAVMQTFQSPGPLFFRQRRSGRRNTPFWIFKFRTMHHAEDWDESRQAVSGDARIYRFGGFLRRTSLDELPQFLNVFRGEMSVVGPRPHLKIHNEAWDKFLKPYHFRAAVKPGVTGLAQIRGLRGEASVEHEIKRRVECDIEYLETWSFFMDLWIVLVTAVQVLFPPRKAR